MAPLSFALLAVCTARAVHGFAALTEGMQTDSQNGAQMPQIIYLREKKRVRRFLMYTPRNYKKEHPIPLWILAPGSSSGPEDLLAVSGLKALADLHTFAIVTLEGVYQRLNVGQDALAMNGRPDDVAYTGAVLRAVARRVAVQQGHIFCSGFSHGARFCSRLASEMSSFIAGIGAFSGVQYPRPNNATMPVAIMAYHGILDPINRYKGATQSAYWHEAVDSSIHDWSEFNGCKSLEQTKFKGIYDAKTYINCAASGAVLLVTSKTGGHTWPGSSYRFPAWFGQIPPASINEDMWRFFKVHAREPMCRQAMEGDLCYNAVKQAMQLGQSWGPAKVRGLTKFSKFEDYQQVLWQRFEANCPHPCRSWGKGFQPRSTHPAEIPVAQPNSASSSVYSIQIKLDGDSRHFHLHIPHGRRRRAQMPLWIFVDDGTSTTIAKATHGAVAFARTQAVAVALLPGESRYADSNVDHVAAVRGLLRKVQQKINIDLRKIFCIGVGAGASLCSTLASKFSSFIAAVGLFGIAGYLQPNHAWRPVPVLSVQDKSGTQNQDVNDAATRWSSFNGCKVTSTEWLTPSLVGEVHTECKHRATVIRANTVGTGTWSLEAILANTDEAHGLRDVMLQFFSDNPFPFSCHTPQLGDNCHEAAILARCQLKDGQIRLKDQSWAHDRLTKTTYLSHFQASLRTHFAADCPPTCWHHHMTKVAKTCPPPRQHEPADQTSPHLVHDKGEPADQPSPHPVHHRHEPAHQTSPHVLSPKSSQWQWPFPMIAVFALVLLAITLFGIPMVRRQCSRGRELRADGLRDTDAIE